MAGNQPNTVPLRSDIFRKPRLLSIVRITCWRYATLMCVDLAARSWESNHAIFRTHPATKSLIQCQFSRSSLLSGYLYDSK